MMGTCQQLSYAQRCQIAALKQRKCTQSKLADIFEVSQSTVSRELARNTGGRVYRHKQAHRKAVLRCEVAVKPTRMTSEMIASIELKLRIEWSPERISGWRLTDQDRLISHESIYLYVWANKQAGGDLYTHPRQLGKKYDKRRNGTSTRGR
ncbi:MAG: IS30 family transposase [Zhongshania sp.]|jgi:IS30 family transposase